MEEAGQLAMPEVASVPCQLTLTALLYQPFAFGPRSALGANTGADASYLIGFGRVSGADPFNLAGIITPGDVVPALATNRILYRDGIPVAVREGSGSGERYLVETTPDEHERLKAALVRGRATPLVRAYLGRTGPRPASTRA